MPFQGKFVIHGLGFATFNQYTKFEISISTGYEDTKSDTKCRHELIRRWDNEREHFYDDIAHVLQNTKKREPTSFNKLDDS